MGVMSCVTEDILSRAKTYIQKDRADIRRDRSKRLLNIDVLLRTESDSARAVIEGSHTHIVRLEHNGREIFRIKIEKSSDLTESEERRILNEDNLHDHNRSDKDDDG
jgi:hypothetical protein